jgi:hypothetical protein
MEGGERFSFECMIPSLGGAANHVHMHHASDRKVEILMYLYYINICIPVLSNIDKKQIWAGSGQKIFQQKDKNKRKKATLNV